jgi:hypothetical protein
VTLDFRLLFLSLPMSKFITKLKHQILFTNHCRCPRPRFLHSPLRLSTIGLIFTFNFSFLTIQSCGLDIEDPTLPSPPVWVQKSFPEEWPERGIDAHESGGIFLEWQPYINDNIISFEIYRAAYYEVEDSLGDFTLLVRLSQSSQSVLEYIDTAAPIGKTMHYTIVAVGDSQIHSDPSDTIYYRRQRAIARQWMIPNSQTDTLSISRQLIWEDHYIEETQDYCLTLTRNSGEILFRQILQPKNYIGRQEIWFIPAYVVLDENNIYKWRVDTAGHYEDGMESAGSESIWATFLYAFE